MFTIPGDQGCRLLTEVSLMLGCESKKGHRMGARRQKARLGKARNGPQPPDAFILGDMCLWPESNEEWKRTELTRVAGTATGLREIHCDGRG